MAYEKCQDVSGELWNDLAAQDPEEVAGRTGAEFRDGRYRLSFLKRILVVEPVARQAWLEEDPEADPGFRACLATLVYLLHINPGALGPPLSPLELPGGATFFRGHHCLPTTALEARFGQDPQGLLAAARRLGGEPRSAGDAAVVLQVFPGLIVEVILWQGDEEFPAQASFTVPSHLDRFWNLDAVWGLLNLAAQEIIRAAAEETP
jgi:hypothetical protein